MKNHFPELNIGLYRDDGLAVHEKLSGPKLDSIRKKLHAVFKDLGLRITVETNKKYVDFLDVSFNINDRSHAPYRKPNDRPLYINVDSNHPSTIIKNIPQNINKRLTQISSSEKEFNEAVRPYNEALKKSGHKQILHFDKDQKDASSKHDSKTNEKEKKKKRQIKWSNPPFNKNVKTNVGKNFLLLIDKHFPKDSPLRQIVNRNCVKVSYSCTQNVKQIIQAHNAKLVKEHIVNQKNIPKKDCNCRKPKECVLKNRCKTGPVVYQASLSIQGKEHIYIGATQDFKERYGNHKASFKNEKIKHHTALSQLVWREKLGPEPIIKWDILQKCSIYERGNRYCDLCLTEKVHIAKNIKRKECINFRTEMTPKCHHKWRHKLNNVKQKC